MKFMNEAVVIVGVAVSLGAGCSSLGKRASHNSLAGQDNAGINSRSDSVDLEGPIKLGGRLFTFDMAQDRAYSIDVDRRLVRDCSPGSGYAVTKLNEQAYVVEIQESFVLQNHSGPVVDCNPRTITPHQTGTSPDFS